jgi:DNA repair protein RadC
MTGAKIMSQPSTSLDSSFFVRDARGRYRMATPEQILDAARHVIDQRVCRGAELTSPQTVRDFLRTKLAGFTYEVFSVMFLDNRHRLIAFVEMFRGTIDGASVYPREVVKEALRHNAAAVIFAHNHPSGVAEPSQADELITLRLKDALGLVDIRVLDHVIVAGNETTSFAARGLI